MRARARRRAVLAALWLLSCSDERAKREAPTPFVAPPSTVADITDDSTSAKAITFYETADFPELIPRRHVGIYGKNFPLATPDDFYRYVIQKLVKLGGREVGAPTATAHMAWLEQAFKDMLGVTSGKTKVRVWREAFEFLGERRDPKPIVRFTFQRTPRAATMSARRRSETVTITAPAEVFDASGNGTCAGGPSNIVALDTKTLNELYLMEDAAGLAAAQAKYKDKLIVVLRDSGLHRSSQAKAVAKVGACGMLYVSDAKDLIQTGSARVNFEPVMRRSTDGKEIPLVTISHAAGASLYKEVMTPGSTGQRLVDFSVQVSGCQIDDAKKGLTSEGASVVAWVPGYDASGVAPTDPGQNDAIIIGGHFDAFHDGAMDNGGGIAVLLAMARQLGRDRFGGAGVTQNIDEPSVTMSGCTSCPTTVAAGNEKGDTVYTFGSGAGRALSKMPDIYFVAYDGEEIGLFGGYVMMLNRIKDVTRGRIRYVMNLETPRGKSAGAQDVLGVSSSGGQNTITSWSKWLWSSGRRLGFASVTYDDATGDISSSPHAGHSRTAPFWAWGHIFEIIRRFGGLPTDIQGFYRAQIPSTSTASEPVTYHTTADTLANEWEGSIWRSPTWVDPGIGFKIPFGAKPTSYFDWQINPVALPFKATYSYEMLWSYLNFYAGNAGPYDAQGDKLTPTGDTARLQLSTLRMGADDDALACDGTKDCVIFVAPDNSTTNVSIVGYRVDLFYSTHAAAKGIDHTNGTFYGFVADDPSAPIDLLDVDGKLKKQIDVAVDAKGSARLTIPKAALSGMSAPGATKLNPWVRVTAIGSVPLFTKFPKYKSGFPMAEMVRPLAIKGPSKTCYSTSLEKDAYCPYSDTCAPACLCVEPDPYSGSACLSWLDEWSCPGTLNPFGKCF